MQKLSILFVALLLWLSPQLLQAQTASERRQAKLKAETSLADFESDDPIFKNYVIPDAWKNRSAVIIAERVELEYGVPKPQRIAGKQRRMVLLQDQGAVERFGSYYFEDTKQNRTGIRIIKPNGEVKNIDMSQAVPVDEETVERTSTFLGTYQRSSYEQKKIALPGLEVGDIIDVVLAYEENVTTYFYPHCFSMMEIPFQAEYPILNKAIQFTLKRGNTINAISTLSAPQLKELGSVDQGKGAGRQQVYAANASMIEEDTTNTSFTYSNRVQPRLKVGVCETKNAEGDEFVGEMGKVKKEVTPSEIQTKMRNSMTYRSYNRSTSVGRTTIMAFYADNTGNYYAKKGYAAMLGNLKRQNVDPLDALDILYYQIRHDFYFGKYNYYLNRLSDELFASIVLESVRISKLPVECKFIVAPGVNITAAENLLNRRELYWFLKAKSGGKTRVYYPISRHGIVSEPIWQLDGVKAQVIEMDKVAKDFRPSFFTPVPAKAEDNYAKVSSEIKIEEGSDLEFNSTYTYAGMSRANISGYLLRFEEIEEEDLKYLNKKLPLKMQPKVSASAKRAKKQEEAGVAFNQQENLRKKKEDLEKRLKRTYEVKEYKDYKIIQTGRYSESRELIFTQNFVASDLLVKAGNNLILNVGMLAGEFSKVDTAKRRVHDIFYDYPATYEWEYRMEVPAGYEADGLDGVATLVSNKAGIFEAKASMEGRTLKVNIRRVYLQSKMSASDWNEMVAFYNAGSQFNQKKVVFRKL
jgi:hypothetical protein